MKIGVAAENRLGEKRVVLRPKEISDIAKDHEILVEKGAGRGININDADYEAAGAKVVGRKEVYSCDLVVRLKEPKEGELRLMRPGSAMMSMMHLSSNKKLRELLKKHKIVAIPMAEIKGPFRMRLIEALHDTGYLAMEKGFELWGGDPSKCAVKVMGYGRVAWGAIRAAARGYASVSVLNKRDIHEMEKHIPGTDILVNGINWPMEMRGKVFLITKDMLKLFKPGAVIVDLVSNPKGQSPIETMRPTTLDNISYKVDGIIHTSCWGWPGLDPVGISRRYSIQVAPILHEIADRGFDDLPPYINRVVVRP